MSDIGPWVFSTAVVLMLGYIFVQVPTVRKWFGFAFVVAAAGVAVLIAVQFWPNKKYMDSNNGMPIDGLARQALKQAALNEAARRQWTAEGGKVEECFFLTTAKNRKFKACKIRGQLADAVSAVIIFTSGGEITSTEIEEIPSSNQ